MTYFFTLVFIVLVFWRPQDWLFPWLYGFPVLNFVVVFAIGALLVENKEGRIRFPRNTPQVYLLAGLWFAAIMSHVAHAYFAGMMATLPDVFKYSFFTALLFVVLDRASRVLIVVRIFVVLSVFMAVHAVMQQKLGYGFAGQLPIWDWRPGKEDLVCRSLFFGIFEDPNDLAQMLSVSIPLAFVVTRRQSFFSFLLSCAITYILVLGIISTHSRGGSLALVGVVVVMIFLVMPERWMPALLLLFCAAGLVVCPFASVWLDASAHDRVVFWGLANQTFKSSPVIALFGVGYGMFWQVADARAPHNAFVGCYTELGFFGYWFWFMLLQLSVIAAWRTRVALKVPQTVEQRWLKRFAGFGLAAIVGYCVSGYFLSRTFIYPLFFLFAMLGCLPAIVQQQLPAGSLPLIRPGKDIFVLGSMGSLISIIYIYVSILLLNKAFGG